MRTGTRLRCTIPRGEARFITPLELVMRIEHGFADQNAARATWEYVEDFIGRPAESDMSLLVRP
jgi:hypothetical protein